MSDRPGTGAPPPRWATVGLPLLLVALVVLAVVAYVVVGDRSDRVSGIASAGAGPVASGQLAGEWAGEGTVTRCAGFDRCDGTRTVSLTINCSGKRCRVVPFDRSYGSPPLRFSGGRYRAVGPLPTAIAPTCGGSPTSSGAWRLDLAVTGGRLTGSYAESTLQSFDCGATSVAWQVALDRT